MKKTATLLFYLLLFSLTITAQDLTGIWKGHFIQKSFGYYEDRYRFEVQIEQLPNNALNGVTYSYKTTVFYGKAELKGIFTKKTNNIVFNETKLVDVKINENSQPCLMTCYLEYAKMGNLETLTGTYTSRNLRDGGDCGSGKVYLEKTIESDFGKEDFLLKREQEKRKQDAAKKNFTPQTKRPPLAKAVPKKPDPKKPVAKANSAKPNVAKPPMAKGIKPGVEANVVRKSTPPMKGENRSSTDVAVDPIVPPKREEIVVKPPKEKVMLPKPDVIKKRVNEIAKVITTSAKEIRIDLYDNGEIDGDTISVYHNHKLIVSKKMLKHKPISFTIATDEDVTHHEFVMVAENLGSIPPNTALMVITAGARRHELFITSTEQKNAVVVVEYKEDTDTK